MCKPKNAQNPPALTKENVLSVLLSEYKAKVLPVEVKHSFDRFHSPPLTEGEIKAKPVVMLLGQYSVGKTSMIEYLCGSKYPGALIGPEPTTDCFTVVHYDDSPHITPGVSLAKNKDLPFQALSSFGSGFASHLKGAAANAAILRYMTFMDTPGILAGEKQTVKRSYDFANIVRFLCDKVDVILLCFDTTKLDISDEFKKVIKNLRGNEEKVKIILNKADMVDEPELVRVRGALMWSLSKIIETPEVPKVNIGSFTAGVKDKSIMNTFKEDYLDLFKELQAVPGRATGRKVNDMIKRVKMVQIHAQLMGLIRGGRMGFQKSPKGREKMLKPDRVRMIFHDFCLKHKLTESDLPELDAFLEKASKVDVQFWVKEDPKLMKQLELFINVEIPKILTAVPHDETPDDDLVGHFQPLIDAVESAPAYGEIKSNSKRGDGDSSKRSSNSGKSKKAKRSKSKNDANAENSKQDEDNANPKGGNSDNDSSAVPPNEKGSSKKDVQSGDGDVEKSKQSDMVL